MWFKNLQLYRFTRPFELDAATLGQQLEQHSFVPCDSQDSTRSGWVPPLGRHGSEYVHSTNGYLMICSKRQDKLLPPAVINEALELSGFFKVLVNAFGGEEASESARTISSEGGVRVPDPGAYISGPAV